MKNNKSKDINPVSVLCRMERMMGGAVEGSKNEYAAQELVYDSWECAYTDDALDLLEQAIELDPRNVDAWLGLMEFTPIDADERIDLLRKLVDTGRKNLDKEYFKNDGGHFWGVLETRPYMRARHQLAIRLIEAGKLKDGVIEYEEILKLNPNDNQGVRYGLMACYLTLNHLDGAQRLFGKYEDDKELGAIFAWAYVLERFLSDNYDGARKALEHAQKVNGYAAAYFLEHRKMPKTTPDSYAMGSREEAIIAWDILKPAWEAHPKAQAWFKKNKDASK